MPKVDESCEGKQRRKAFAEVRTVWDPKESTLEVRERLVGGGAEGKVDDGSLIHRRARKRHFEKYPYFVLFL